MIPYSTMQKITEVLNELSNSLSGLGHLSSINSNTSTMASYTINNDNLLKQVLSELAHQSVSIHVLAKEVRRQNENMELIYGIKREK